MSRSGWINALRAEDLGMLQQLSRYPFRVRDAAEAVCKTGVLTRPPELQRLVDCLREEQFRDELRSEFNTDPRTQVLGANELPPWANRWLHELHPDLTPIAFAVTGNGISFEVVLIVGPTGVHAVWKDTAFEPN